MARRQQTCPIEASNIANLGSDLEKNIKRAAAECERAWDGVGQPGIRIWRIEKFKVVEWPRNQIGKFYNGDSYIILHSYKPTASAPVKHDIHFWLGEHTSQDEAGTAAYKTVELDDKLGGAPVQHREVQGHESDLFVGYFPENVIEVMEGGIESGFNHVVVDQYPTRLLHVKGSRQNVRVSQVPTSYKSLNSGDSFILDMGLEIYQWNGKQSSLFEKMRASQIVRAIKDERGGRPEAYIFDEGDKDKELDKFWKELGTGKIASAKSGGDDAEAAQAVAAGIKLFRLSDKKGDLKFTLEKSGDLSKSDLDSNDAFILDNGSEVFVWIGKKSSKNERKYGMDYADRYLRENNRPAHTPISRVVEGGENSVFNLNFSSGELSRDLNLNDQGEWSGRAPCCPHHAEGSNRWASQPAAVSQLVRQQYGGRKPGGPVYSPARQVSQQQYNSATQSAFAFFKNQEHVNSSDLYKFH